MFDKNKVRLQASTLLQEQLEEASEHLNDIIENARSQSYDLQYFRSQMRELEDLREQFANG